MNKSQDTTSRLVAPASRPAGRNSNQQEIVFDLAIPAPMADVLSFPLARRVHLVGKTAARVFRTKSQERAEKLLAAAVQKQRAAMTRKRIPSHKVERECRTLENAIRARLWCLILIPPTGNDAA